MKRFVAIAALCACGLLVSAQQRSLRADLTRLAQSPSYSAMVCAHRGNTHAGLTQFNLAQSSLAALEQAILDSIDMIEVDGRQTADGQLINLHDATIDAFTTGSGTIANMTLAQIQTYFLKNPDGTASTEHPHTLREMFMAAKDRVYVVVDMKEGAIGLRMAELADSLGMLDQIMWYFPNSEKAGANAIYQRYPYAILMPYSSSTSFLETLHGRYNGLRIFHTALEKINSDAYLRPRFEQYEMIAYANCLNNDWQIASGDMSYLSAMVANNIRFIQSDYGDIVVNWLNENGLHYRHEDAPSSLLYSPISSLPKKIFKDGQILLILPSGTYNILGQKID